MMRRSLLFTIALIALRGVSALAYASGDAPGSSGDPVVSKSYVDARTSFSPIELAAGQRLLGGEGTEIVLRSGEATAIDNGSNGVSDLTSGTDLMTGNQVVSNHLLLVPRDDGRGITAVTEVWVLVRGDYTIQ
jgi:hypothetical protein